MQFWSVCTADQTEISILDPVRELNVNWETYDFEYHLNSM